MKFTKQEFEGDIVRRHLPNSRLAAGSVVVDESTYETIRQKLVVLVIGLIIQSDCK